MFLLFSCIGYSFGGFAKTNDDLKDFIHHFPVSLDSAYSAKVVYAMFDLLKKQSAIFSERSGKTNANIVIIHTGVRKHK